MKLYVGVTDGDWYRRLSAARPDEVNFWQPTGNRAFRALQPNEIFLFKLHAPDNFIVGGGIFIRQSSLPCSLAWEAFGTKNGVESLAALVQRVRRYAPANDSPDPIIGCKVLAEPFFFAREEWIPVPEGWAPNIVQGRSYSLETAEGALLWASVLARRPDWQHVDGETTHGWPSNDGPRYGAATLICPRLGQGAFRVLVTDAYDRRCAMTGEKTLPVLEAAHIKPYAHEGPHDVRNGLLLRSDLHKLFDLRYVTVTPELKFQVSSRLAEDWKNGREYYKLHGQKLLVVPQRSYELPAKEYLAWHSEQFAA